MKGTSEGVEGMQSNMTSSWSIGVGDSGCSIGPSTEAIESRGRGARWRLGGAGGEERGVGRARCPFSGREQRWEAVDDRRMDAPPPPTSDCTLLTSPRGAQQTAAGKGNGGACCEEMCGSGGRMARRGVEWWRAGSEVWWCVSGSSMEWTSP